MNEVVQSFGVTCFYSLKDFHLNFVVFCRACHFPFYHLIIFVFAIGKDEDIFLQEEFFF